MNRKYALCVGNNYPGTSAELSGCVNDALDWNAVLHESGYQVTLLLEANHAEVVTALKTMVDLARFSDRIVFTYSGHGTWLPDADGDEADGRDEALVMADYRSGGLLLDDELQSIFSNLRYGAGALILSDSCHSGTVTRFFDAGRTPRFLSPTEILPDLTLGRALELERTVKNSTRKTANLISGCDDPEYSYDAWFNGRANGAFTRAAIDTYRPGIKLGAWHKAIRTKLPNEDYPQSPQLQTSNPYRKYARAI